MNFELSDLHTNQRLLINELLYIGAKVKLIDKYDELFEIEIDNKKDYLQDRYFSNTSYHVTKITADKFLTKNILKEKGFSVPYAEIFNYKNDIDFLLERYRSLVIKPVWGSHGDNIFTNIRSKKEFNKIIQDMHLVFKDNESFLIERFVPYQEYRIFITKQKEFAVIHRECASVIGNGMDSILELVEEENERRLNLKKELNTSLCPIILDYESERYLEKKYSYNHYSILEEDEKVFLRGQSNLAKGGTSIDYTDKVHQQYIDIAWNVLNLFPGLPAIGLDVLIKNIANPTVNDYDYFILEVNSNPGLTMHHYPAIGKERNVAKMLLNVYLKEIRK